VKLFKLFQDKEEGGRKWKGMRVEWMNKRYGK
jgi:hypothetical protein